jgi:glyoxylase-like metal-dependent hydrolase (beta-lactamase superfamily II)
VEWVTKQSEKFFSHYEPHGSKNLETSLHEFGFFADDITDVFLTHLHFDHCGGAIKFDEQHKPVPAFRNATYYSCEKHWLTATKPNQRRESVFPEREYYSHSGKRTIKNVKGRR